MHVLLVFLIITCCKGCICSSTTKSKIPTTEQNGEFFLFIPDYGYTGEVFSIVAYVTSVSSPVHLSATLNGQLINESAIINPNEVGTLQFKVPDNLQTSILSVSGTGGMSFTHVKRQTILSRGSELLIQTDKGVYKQGQKLRIRVISLQYSNMTLDTSPITVYLQDGKQNKVARWPCELTTRKPVCEATYQIADHPVLGRWKIVAAQDKEEQLAYISVEEYVLPKYKIKLSLEKFQFAFNTQFGTKWFEPIKGALSSKYFFGKAINGHAVLKIIEISTTIYEMKIPLSSDGQTKFSVDPKHFQDHVIRTWYTYYLECSVYDDESGDSHSVKESFRFTSTYLSVAFVEHSTALKAKKKNHTRLLIKLFVGYNLGSYQIPLDEYDEKLLLDVRENTSKKLINRKSLKINKRGHVKTKIHFQTPNETQIYLEASFRTIRSTRVINLIEEENQSQLEGRNQRQLSIKVMNKNVKLDDHVTIKVFSSKPNSTVYYNIYSRNILKKANSLLLEGTKGDILIHVTIDMTPSFNLIVYTISEDGKITMTSTNIDVTGFYPDELSLSYDKDKVKPGEKVSLSVSTEKPFSSVFLSAVDTASQAMGNDNVINHQMIENNIKSLFTRRVPRDHSDPSYVLRSLGIGFVHKRELMTTNQGRPWFYVAATPRILSTVFFASLVKTTTLQPLKEFKEFESGRTEEKVRQSFPETWIWDSVFTNSYGVAHMNLTVPDTITTWDTAGFCSSQQLEFGLSRQSEQLLTFKDFFIQMNLPFSVIRGEVFALRVSVFNYRQHNLKVVLILKKSNDYKSVVVDETGEIRLVSSEQEKTVKVRKNHIEEIYFPISPVRGGEIAITVTALAESVTDTVRRKLIVKYEGIEQRFSLTNQLSLKGNSQKFAFLIPYPENVVQDSQRVEVTILGSPLGNAVNNLEGSLYMPSGCGEQNMKGFVQAIVVLDYLESVRSARSSVRHTAIEYMKIGYSRELRYRHPDGTYSVWGGTSGTGSKWLTAYVMKSFAQASSYIYISDDVIETGVRALIRDVIKSGAIVETGYTPSSYLTGGSTSSEIAMTSFVLIALAKVVQVNKESAEIVREALPNALEFVVSSVRPSNNSSTDLSNYTLAVASYALLLFENPAGLQLLSTLAESAEIGETEMYWKGSVTPKYYSWSPPNGATSEEVETAGYALLSYVIADQSTNAFMIMNWLVKRQNPKGGFVSTQDTVIALQAMAAYAKKYVKPTWPVTVTIIDEADHVFVIDQSNEDLLIKKEMKGNLTAVKMAANGTGNIITQINVFYNILSDVMQPSYNLSVIPMKPTEYGFKLNICFNKIVDSVIFMTILEIGLPTGHTTAEDKVKAQLGQTPDKFEADKDKVYLYCGPLTSGKPNCVDAEIRKEEVVGNLKTVPVRVYDYYEPSSSVTQFYQPPIVTSEAENNLTERRQMQILVNQNTRK